MENGPEIGPGVRSETTTDPRPSGPADRATAREHLSALRALLALSVVMADRDEEEILRIALDSVGSVSPCEACAGYLADEGQLVARSPTGTMPGSVLDAQVAALAGEDGPATVADHDWARAYALSSTSGLRGYLVIGSAQQPSADEQFLLRVLAQQAGAGLAAAALRRREHEHVRQHRSVAEQLARSVAELQEHARIHDELARGAAAADSEKGIAAAVHRLTGLPAIVEDRFGNLRAWAGPGEPKPYPKPSSRSRTDTVRRAQRAGGPVRDRDRLLALAQPGSEVLGTIALLDPEGAATPTQVLTLKQAATVLGTELAHQRGLDEVELRLRRDLIDDLLNGTRSDTDEAGAVARARALGHDLHAPHRVVVIRAQDRDPDQVTTAAERAAATLDMKSLITTRSDMVVLLAQRPSAWGDRLPWPQLHAAVSRHIRSATAVTIGVGGVYEHPGDAARSWQEALHALDVRLKSRRPDGVTVWDDLGIYRILTAAKDDDQVDGFIREWLGPLLDYDATHDTELVKTLAAYLESGGNYDEAAEELVVHRSTLRYRLKRIRQITGLRLTEADNRLNLHLATRAWALLERPP
ncbi:PucR family transcriptional regulator [Pseudonocardia bannensis]|uniref:Transcriptional regulator n=1 Tax=Pseudonocardia bannensis TaxID=630973 RepID=A0A848DL24_9PSEU|nr:helix-turn-helix domain-containing protein [Pseudonocardia bannensis]NMH93265.1 transcriptional regulator [Pseudonocardia bannensis]